MLFALPFLVASSQVKAQALRISIDTKSAEAVCNALAEKKKDTATLNALTRMYGNALLIQKVKGYSGAGDSVFVSTLKELIATGNIQGDDPYNWKEVRAKLPQIRSLLLYINTHKDSFVKQVTALIQPYVPDTLHADARAVFLAGGGALGFTLGNDPSFNVAVQKIGDDVDGLMYLVAHELYHTVQHAGQHTRHVVRDTSAPYAALASYYLLYNLWTEGTATYVGDFNQIKKLKPFAAEQVAEYKKNRERNTQNFRLFEALLYRQYYDTAAQYDDSYNIAFSTAFDETGYYVGYEMAKKLVKYKGDSALAELLVKDPIRFTSDYIALYKAHPDDDSFHRFGGATEEIVKALMKWEGKL